MSKRCVLLASNSATSGRALAEATGALARYGPNLQCEAIIRYGSAREVACVPTEELNSRESVLSCTDKLCSLRLMARAGVPVPEVTTARDVRLPALGRRRHHTRGKDIAFCRTDEDVERALRQGSEYFVRYVAKHREYRIHVFRGSVIKMNVKQPHPDWEGRHSNLVRSLHHGWRFRSVNPALDPDWDEVLSTSVQAVKALGLDFGAVDIARDTDDRLWVFEVNSAPALGSTPTLRAYADAVNHYLAEREATDICARYLE